MKWPIALSQALVSVHTRQVGCPAALKAAAVTGALQLGRVTYLAAG